MDLKYWRKEVWSTLSVECLELNTKHQVPLLLDRSNNSRHSKLQTLGTYNKHH